MKHAPVIYVNHINDLAIHGEYRPVRAFNTTVNVNYAANLAKVDKIHPKIAYFPFVLPDKINLHMISPNQNAIVLNDGGDVTK